MSLAARAEANIVERGLIGRGARVLAGVSGGVDSMVLLDVLAGLAPQFGWNLAVVHFNHQLRGAASEADEEFVRSAASTRGLPFRAGRGDVAIHAHEHGLSIEMAARELRHRFFAAQSTTCDYGTMALAHHADDQIETFWLRLLRGEVGSDFAGMRWKRRSAFTDKLEIVRPFLNISKSEILNYATQAGIAFREDASNQDTRMQRNQLRHEVLPALELYQPRLRNITLRASQLLLEQSDFISKSATNWLDSRMPVFGDLHPVVQREVVRLHLLVAEVRPNSELIDELREFPEREICVQPGVTVCLDHFGNLVVRDKTAPEFKAEREFIQINGAGKVTLGCKEVSWELVSQRDPKKDNCEYFDATTIGPGVTLRFWQPGDRFQPIGNEGASKLQDLFTTLKVPPEERRSRLVATTEAGEIFWVEGLRIGETFKVRPETRRVLKWNWQVA